MRLVCTPPQAGRHERTLLRQERADCRGHVLPAGLRPTKEQQPRAEGDPHVRTPQSSIFFFVVAQGKGKYIGGWVSSRVRNADARTIFIEIVT
jgi:hypothetical protein